MSNTRGEELEQEDETEISKTSTPILVNLFEEEIGEEIAPDLSEKTIGDIEAISNYYKLKSQYESKINDFKRKLLGNAGLTKKEKRKKFKSFVPKCIVCKKNGGTVFSNKNRTLKAVCGASPPCNLDIEIAHGMYVSREVIVKLLKEEFEEIKTSIIMTKLNLLFNYINEPTAIKLFEEKRKELNDVGENYKNKLTETLLITDNPTKKNNIEKSLTTLYLTIQQLQTLISDFDAENNEQLITDAVELYKGRILPTAERIRNLKYSYNAVEYNDDNNTYHLIQDAYTIVQLETDVMNETIKVIKNNY
jgi:hypothetical protein